MLDAAGIEHVPDDEYDAHHAGIVTVHGNPRTLGSTWHYRVAEFFQSHAAELKPASPGLQVFVDRWPPRDNCGGQ